MAHEQAICKKQPALCRAINKAMFVRARYSMDVNRWKDAADYIKCALALHPGNRTAKRLLEQIKLSASPATRRRWGW